MFGQLHPLYFVEDPTQRSKVKRKPPSSSHRTTKVPQPKPRSSIEKPPPLSLTLPSVIDLNLFLAENSEKEKGLLPSLFSTEPETSPVIATEETSLPKESPSLSSSFAPSNSKVHLPLETESKNREKDIEQLLPLLPPRGRPKSICLPSYTPIGVNKTPKMKWICCSEHRHGHITVCVFSHIVNPLDPCLNRSFLLKHGK